MQSLTHFWGFRGIRGIRRRIGGSQYLTTLPAIWAKILGKPGPLNRRQAPLEAYGAIWTRIVVFERQKNCGSAKDKNGSFGEKKTCCEGADKTRIGFLTDKFFFGWRPTPREGAYKTRIGFLMDKPSLGGGNTPREGPYKTCIGFMIKNCACVCFV